MKDHELDSLLRGLPQHRAPAGFVARVQRSLHHPPPAPLRRLRLALAAGVLVFAMVGVGTGLRRGNRGAGADDLRRELAALQTELEAIESTLERERTLRKRELVYVGGDERADYFVEPSRLPAPRGHGAVVPVTYRGEEL